MISLVNIKTVARYERKILSRSWFFRIFSALSILIIGAITAALLFDNSSFNWGFKALASAVSYNALLMLNIVQSILAIFLASDFLKRDKKLDTAEVLFIRPMSNSDYVVGKTWGIFSLFMMLNLFILLVTAILTLSSGTVTLVLMPYVWYLLIISISSLIFVLGLSFFMMSLLRNQALTFLILLGYIAGVLFYLAKKEYFIFDFLSFKLPLIYSDIIGFSQPWLILLQRLIYVFAGLGFIAASILLLKRLPQSKGTKIVSLSVFILAIGLSATSLLLYLNQNRSMDAKHSQMALLSPEYFNVPTARVSQYKLMVDQGNIFSGVADMWLVNDNQKEIKQLVFSLNTGLNISSVEQNGEKINFNRDQFVVLVPLKDALGVGDSIPLKITYEGKIDKSDCYLDANSEKFNKSVSYNTISLNQEFGFSSDNFTLLTNEDLWYPIGGIPYDATLPSVFKQEFTRFILDVKTKPGLLPLSQGPRVKLGENDFEFKPEKPLTQISLVIGKYIEKEINVKDINLRIAYMNGHDYFSSYLNELGDTLPELFKDFIENYERPLSMTYPYHYFTLVEVPVQFKALEHSWTATMANSQPQMVLFPEKGFAVRQADFKNSLRRQDRNNKQNNLGLVAKEMQANVLKEFLNVVFKNESGQFNFNNREEGIPANPYTIYPNYYNYVNYIQSDVCPVLNYAIESYLNEGEVDPRSMFFAQNAGLTDADKANILLNGKSLKQIIATEEDKAQVNKVLKLKGEYLLAWIQKQAGDQDLGQFLRNYLNENRYKAIQYNEFSDEIRSRFNFELNQFINDWYNVSEIPAYMASPIEYFRTVNKNQQVIVARINVTNYGNVGGIVKFTAMMGQGRPGPGMQMEPVENIYYIGANETQEIQMVFDDMPRFVQFNTLISKNIPSNNLIRRDRGDRATTDNKMKPVAYNRVIDKPVTLKNEGEFVCDNTSKGFSVYDPNSTNRIKNFFNKKDTNEIIGLNFWESPATWKKAVNSQFYGTFEHSGMVVRSGDGDKTATWTTELPEKGYYDIYTYIFEQRQRRRGRDNQSGESGSYFYTVYHDDGVDEVEVELKDVQSGWNLLGSFYLSPGKAKVTLSNKSEARRVIADAVRWVQEGAKIEKLKKPEKSFNENEQNRRNGGERRN